MASTVNVIVVRGGSTPKSTGASFHRGTGSSMEVLREPVGPCAGLPPWEFSSMSALAVAAPWRPAECRAEGRGRGTGMSEKSPNVLVPTARTAVLQLTHGAAEVLRQCGPPVIETELHWLDRLM